MRVRKDFLSLSQEERKAKIAQIIRDYESGGPDGKGMTMEEVAKKNGVGGSTVFKILNAAGKSRGSHGIRRGKMQAWRKLLAQKDSIGRLIPENQAPQETRVRIPPTELLALCNRIKPGFALEGTEKEFGVRIDTVRDVLRRLKAKGLVSKAFRIHVSKGDDGVKRIYIVNHEEETTP